MNQQIDLNTLTVEQLESFAYKNVVIRDQAIRNIQMAEQVMMQKMPKPIAELPSSNEG